MSDLPDPTEGLHRLRGDHPEQLLGKFSEPGRPEFRNYKMTEEDKIRALNSIANIYNEINRNNPNWTPMEIFPLPKESSS